LNLAEKKGDPAGSRRKFKTWKGGKKTHKEKVTGRGRKEKAAGLTSLETQL